MKICTLPYAVVSPPEFGPAASSAFGRIISQGRTTNWQNDICPSYLSSTFEVPLIADSQEGPRSVRSPGPHTPMLVVKFYANLVNTAGLRSVINPRCANSDERPIRVKEARVQSMGVLRRSQRRRTTSRDTPWRHRVRSARGTNPKVA